MRVPGGGASCLRVGRAGSGALRPPTARPLGGLPGPTTHWLWVRGGAGVGTRHQPHSARSCELALRAVGAARGRPGGGASCLGVGRPGTGALQPQLPALWAGCRGPVPTGCGCGGLRAWGLVTNPTARAFACCGGGMRVPGGGASCLGVGRAGSGALPPPTARPLGGLSGPTTHLLWVRGDAGVGTQHQPHSARLCELALRAVGAAKGRPGGRLLPGCGASGVGCSPPTARPLGGLPGPSTHWLWVRGGAGVGTRHQPHSARFCVLWRRHEGARGGPLLPGCGVRGRALSHPRLPALWAGCPGPLPTGCGRGGLRAWGPVTNPTARALASWPCALWGRHEGPRGGHFLPGCGAYGDGRSSTPNCLPSGRAAGAHYPLDVGAGGCGRRDPSPTPQCALLRAGLARCGGGTRAPGGGASCMGVGRPRSGALPAPTARPLGGLPRPTTQWLWVLGERAWGPVTNPTARALASWLCALWERHEGARGGRFLPGCGASGVGRSPIPNCPPSGRAAGAHYPLAVGAGGCGRGDPSPTPQRALLRAGFARCGGGTRAPREGALCLGVGRPGSGAPQAPTARPLGGLPGPTTHRLRVRGERVWEPVTNPTARALACCGAGLTVPGGGASCLGVGRPGPGALPPPTARPLGGLPGPTTHWLWVRGGAGVGTRHQPHSARSCVLWGRHEGARGGRLLPG